MKIAPFNDKYTLVKGYFFDCPGCKIGHSVAIAPHKFANGASWTFNGDLERPTFNPSILSTVGYSNGNRICHLFVKGGMLEFLPDCSHELAGQTVEMEEVTLF